MLVPKRRWPSRKEALALRALELRPAIAWIPDTQSAAFAAEAHRQSLIVANARAEADDQAFIDDIGSSEAVDESVPRGNQNLSNPSSPRRRGSS